MARSDINWLRETPIAHRGLHDKANGRFENTLSAAKAAMENGYAIEVDLHPSREGVPMVFHDNVLDRLTDQKGPFRNHTADDLCNISIGGTSDCVPRLETLLELVNSKSGLVLELKGIAGDDAGFVKSVLKILEGYSGPVAIMSFNHWLLEDARALNCPLPVGLTADGNDDLFDIHSNAVTAYNIDFISYGINDLPNRFVRDFRKTGKPVISWTIKNQEQVEKSAKYADQITFEGFLA